MANHAIAYLPKFLFAFFGISIGDFQVLAPGIKLMTQSSACESIGLTWDGLPAGIAEVKGIGPVRKMAVHWEARKGVLLTNDEIAKAHQGNQPGFTEQWLKVHASTISDQTNDSKWANWGP